MTRNIWLTSMLFIVALALFGCAGPAQLANQKAQATSPASPGQATDNRDTPAVSVAATGASRLQPVASQEPYPAWNFPKPLSTEFYPYPYPVPLSDMQPQDLDTRPPDELQKPAPSPSQLSTVPALSTDDTLPTKMPAPSTTPLSPLRPASDTPPADGTGLEIARHTLLRFFTYLHDGRYAEAAPLWGGNYQDMPILTESEDPARAWENNCGVLMCMLVSAVVEETKVAPGEFVFVIEFVTDEGLLFRRGACCGASEAEMPTTWQWPYTVKKVDGKFKVMGMPPYVP